MIILGIEPVAWQDTQYVLRQFGPTENEARRCYLEYAPKWRGWIPAFAGMTDGLGVRHSGAGRNPEGLPLIIEMLPKRDEADQRRPAYPGRRRFHRKGGVRFARNRR
jgi:hypothetical protein